MYCEKNGQFLTVQEVDAVRKFKSHRTIPPWMNKDDSTSADLDKPSWRDPIQNTNLRSLAQMFLRTHVWFEFASTRGRYESTVPDRLKTIC